MKFSFIVVPLVVCLGTGLMMSSVYAQGAPQGQPQPGDAGGTPPPPSVPASPQKVAEVLRMTTARVIDAAGLASKPMAVNKGAKFDLVSEGLGDVVVTKSGQKLRLAKGDVKIYEKDPNAPVPAVLPPGVRPLDPHDPRAIAAAQAEAARADEAAAMAAFQPGGELQIISAKYSLPGNQPRNVKNKVEKLIPPGPLTQPVKILVSDELSRAAANQPAYTVIRTENSTTILEAPKNILTVVYQYNGQKRTKQAREGATLFLP